MLILLSSTSAPAVSKIGTFLREAFAATPLGIVAKAVRQNLESRAPARRSGAVAAVRAPR